MTQSLDNQNHARFVEQQLLKQTGSKPLDMAQTVQMLLSEMRLMRKEFAEFKQSLVNQYVGTKEACMILGIGRTTLMERIKAGEYPFAFQDSTGHWRFKVSELERSMVG